MDLKTKYQPDSRGAQVQPPCWKISSEHQQSVSSDEPYSFYCHEFLKHYTALNFIPWESVRKCIPQSLRWSLYSVRN